MRGFSVSLIWLAEAFLTTRKEIRFQLLGKQKTLIRNEYRLQTNKQTNARNSAPLHNLLSGSPKSAVLFSRKGRKCIQKLVAQVFL
jgi:hypothetical protein